MGALKALISGGPALRQMSVGAAAERVKDVEGGAGGGMGVFRVVKGRSMIRNGDGILGMGGCLRGENGMKGRMKGEKVRRLVGECGARILRVDKKRSHTEDCGDLVRCWRVRRDRVPLGNKLPSRCQKGDDR